MCGFVSIFAYHSAAPPVDPHEVRLIREHMAARGPDGSGEWISPDRRVAMGTRRLAIIDLSSAGDQPMVSANGRYLVAFNGEVYNYQDLREELSKQGRVFRSNSDTEVLLHLYEESGPAMVDRLRGMFAFAIWDQDARTMFLARDPYGIKPLYYADNGSTIRIASQVKALQAGGAIGRSIDPAGAAGFFMTGSVPEPFTIYSDIRSLPAGSTMVIRDGSAPEQPRRYFSVSQIYAENRNSRNPHSSFAAAIRESVRYHLVSDVPVGAFLSAGIDSASLLAVARDAGAVNLETITLTFDEFRGTSVDESPLADQVARRYGTRHTSRVVTRKEFEQDRDGLLRAMDQPSIDGVNTWFVSKAAAEQGLKVALSGLGGDELLGGYPSFREIPHLVRATSRISRVPVLGRTVRRAWSWLPIRGTRQKAGGLLEFGGTYPGAYFLKRALFLPWELPAVLGRGVVEEGLRRLDYLRLAEETLQPDPEHPYARVAALESSLYMRNQLLRDADWASMAHSVEVRVPLVDAFLLRQVAGTVMSLNGLAKQQLALAPSKPVPEAVRLRRKTGFGVPLDQWLRNSKSSRRYSVARRWAIQVYEAFAAR